MLQASNDMQHFLASHPAIKALPRRAVRQAKEATENRRPLSFHRQPDEIADRATFNAVLAEHLAARKDCAVMLFAIDGLADIGERYGDAIADDVVDQFAFRLHRLEPLAGCLAKLSDDVFALLVTEIHSASEAEAIALRFTRGLEQPFTFGKGGLCVSASIGIALAPLHGRFAAPLCDAASQALDMARAMGGGAWHVCDTVCNDVDTRIVATAQSDIAAKPGAQRRVRFAADTVLARFGTAARSAVLGMATSLMMHTPAAGMTMPHYGAAGQPLDPLFNMPYNPAEVHFDSIQLSRFGDCAEMLGSLGRNGGEAKLFGMVESRGGVIAIVGDEDPRAPRGLSGTLVVARNGSCRVSGPLLALRRIKIADPDLDPGLSNEDVSALMQDVLTRYARAFGGKGAFLSWADNLTTEAETAYETTPGMPCPLPFTTMFSAQMRGELDEFRRS